MTDGNLASNVRDANLHSIGTDSNVDMPEQITVRDPLKKRKRGRPPTKRHKSYVEKLGEALKKRRNAGVSQNVIAGELIASFICRFTILFVTKK